MNDFAKTFTLPESVTSARQRAEQLTSEAQDYKAGEASVIDVLRQKVTQAYADNKDIIQHLDQSIAEYLASPSVGRDKFQNVWNPFQREALVSQYTTNQATPMLTNAGILGQRMGRIEDTIGAGVRGFAAQSSRAQNAANSALDEYDLALKEFSLLEDLKARAEEMKLNREKYETDKDISYKQLAKSGSSSGTLFERQQTYYQKAADEAQNGATLSNLQSKYGSYLGTEEVVKVYAANTPYGTPEEPYAKEILGIQTKETNNDSADNTPWYRDVANFFGIY